MSESSIDNKHSTEILNKNLEEYALFDPALALQIAEVECEGYEFCYTHLGELNLVKDGSKPVYYHSMYGARMEALEWFQAISSKITEQDRIILYGVGLGYYCEALKEWFDKSPRNILIFIEDDLAVLRRFFETENASKVLANPQVVILYFNSKADNPRLEFNTKVGKILRGYTTGVSYLSSLKVYATIKEDLCLLIRDQIFSISTWFTVVKNEITDTKQHVFENYYSNMLRQYEAYDFHKMRNAFEGVPAVICGAGPSIVNDIETIRSLQDKAIIIASGTGMNVLNHYGIEPHFGTGLDPTPSQGTRIRTNYAYETPFIYRIRFHGDSFKLIQGPKLFVQKSSGYKISEWFEPKLGIKSEDIEEGGVSSSNFAMEAAKILGCSPIILVGIDLAYTDASRYPRMIAEHPADKPSAKKEISMLSDAPIIGHTCTGKKVMTKVDWLEEASTIFMFVHENRDFTVINATVDGLGIRGMRYMPLEKVKEKYLNKSMDIGNRIHAEIQNSWGDFDKKVCESALKEWKDSVERCCDLYREIIDELESLQTRCREGQTLPPPPYSGHLSLLEADLWSEIAYNYMVTENATYLDTISTPEKIRYRTHKHRFTKQIRDLKKLAIDLDYCTFFYNKLRVHKHMLERLFEVYDREEALLATKKEGGQHKETSSKDQYELVDGRLKIFDEELEIDIDIPFSPQLLPEKAKEPRKEGERLGEVFLTYQGALEGQYLYYYNDGTLLGESFYHEGKLHGPSRFYGKNGTLVAESWYVEGLCQGKNYRYYKSGAPYCLLKYKDGKQEGEQVYYHENGSVKSVMHFKHGIFDGPVSLYYSNGQKKRELNFREGKLEGMEWYWDPGGNPIWEAEYRKGRPYGTARAWHTNQVLAREYIYFEDQKHYNYKEWNCNGELIYKEDNIAEDMRESQMKKQRDLYYAIRDFNREISVYDRLTKRERKQLLY